MPATTLTETITEYRLGSAAQIPRGEGRVFSVAGHEIAVFYTRDGSLYATQAECPHRQGPLADGLIGGLTLMCPLHSRKFNLATGVELSGECSLQTYGVRLTEEGEIILTVD